MSNNWGQEWSVSCSLICLCVSPFHGGAELVLLTRLSSVAGCYMSIANIIIIYTDNFKNILVFIHFSIERMEICATISGFMISTALLIRGPRKRKSWTEVTLLQNCGWHPKSSHSNKSIIICMRWGRYYCSELNIRYWGDIAEEK